MFNPFKKKSEEQVKSESIDMVYEFSKDNTVNDVDESLLMKMQKGPVKKVWDQVMSLYKIIQDPKTDKALKALGIGALIYLITPLDVVPDAIPALGLTDDVGVIMYVMAQILKKRK